MPFSGKKNEAVQLRPGIISAGQDRPKSHTDPLEQRGQPIIGVRPLSPPRSISFPIAEPDAQGNRVVPSSVAGFIDPTAPLQSPSWTDGQAAAAVLNNVATQKRQLQQASTTLLKLTPDGRPFSEDLAEIFTTLIISLPLRSHRHRLKSYPHSITNEELVRNLNHLQVSQSNRQRDPTNPGRIITTRTTTAFSMSDEKAKTLCQRFIAARLLVHVIDPAAHLHFTDGVLWRLTAKGVQIVRLYCGRHGTMGEAFAGLLAQYKYAPPLLSLDRDPVTDRISNANSFMELLFGRFLGAMPGSSRAGNRDATSSPRPASSASMSKKPSSTQTKRLSISTMPELSSNVLESNFRSLTVATGLAGVACASPDLSSVSKFIFTGRDGLDWLLTNTYTVDETDGIELLLQFLSNGLVQRVETVVDNTALAVSSPKLLLKPTELGRRVAGWSDSPARSTARPRSPVGSDSDRSERRLSGLSDGSLTPLEDPFAEPQPPSPVIGAVRSSTPNRGNTISTRDAEITRLDQILADPALRILFREYLAQTFCEENLVFYNEVDRLVRRNTVDKKTSNSPTVTTSPSTPTLSSPTTISSMSVEDARDALAKAYSFYNAYIAPGSPCEVNLDWALRAALMTRMTSEIANTETAIREALVQVVELFEKAAMQVYRLMASDSVPKFLQSPANLQLMQSRGGFDHVEYPD